MRLSSIIKRHLIKEIKSIKNSNNIVKIVHVIFSGQDNNELFYKLSLLYAKDYILSSKPPTIILSEENQSSIKFHSFDYNFILNRFNKGENYLNFSGNP